jgi:hypothetical protein
MFEVCEEIIVTSEIGSWDPIEVAVEYVSAIEAYEHACTKAGLPFNPPMKGMEFERWLDAKEDMEDLLEFGDREAATAARAAMKLLRS